MYPLNSNKVYNFKLVHDSIVLWCDCFFDITFIVQKQGETQNTFKLQDLKNDVQDNINFTMKDILHNILHINIKKLEKLG